MRKNRFLLIAGVFALVVILASCGSSGDDPGLEYAPNMYHSVAYEPLKQITDEESGTFVNNTDDNIGEYYSSNPNNEHGMNMRMPVANTIRRGDYLPYHIPKDSFALAERVLMNPLDSTAAIVAQGKLLYQRFCSHCHGEDGSEPGLVGEVYAGVVSYQSAAVKDKKAGHIFHVITEGKGRMSSHASQLSVEERWKIVRYVQLLQQK